ncbi:MAG: hypothetical protein ACK5N9_24305, partial [Pirellula sp.]
NEQSHAPESRVGRVLKSSITCRDRGDACRYLKEYLAEEIPFLNRHVAHIDTRKRVVEQMDSLPKGIYRGR